MLRRDLVTRIAAGLLVLYVAGSIAVGIFAYSASVRAITAEALYANEVLSRALRDLAEELHAMAPDQPVESVVETAWHRSRAEELGRFLCFVRRDGQLTLHTERPEERGTDISRQLLGFPEDSLAPRIHDVLEGERDWSGENLTQTGVPQVVSYSYSRALGGMIGVHIPKVTLEEAENAATAPWILALIGLSGVLLPIAFGLLHFAYRHQLHATERAEAQRRVLEARLEEAHRIDAIGRLAGGVAHDFNNMLTVVLSYTELLRKDLQSQSARENLDGIVVATRHAAKLTAELLAFGRRQVLTPEVVDICEVIERSTPVLKGLAGPDVELEIDVRRPLLPVRVDPSKLEQVLANLVLNARQAIEPMRSEVHPGSIRVHVQGSRQLPPERPRVEDAPCADPRAVWIRITDDGVGMNAETQARLFEPFFTTKAVGEGTGLGMSMVHGTITQSGGAIFVDSSPGEGTSISLLLPGVKRSELAPERPLRPAREPGSPHILLVEDQAPLRRILARALSHAGFGVCDVADGEAGLSAIEQEGAESFDLIIADVQMPRLSGPELVSRIEAQSSNPLRVLFISGYPAPDGAREHGQGSACLRGYPVLEKPFSLNDFIARVNDILGRPSPAKHA